MWDVHMCRTRHCSQLCHGAEGRKLHGFVATGCDAQTAEPCSQRMQHCARVDVQLDAGRREHVNVFHTNSLEWLEGKNVMKTELEKRKRGKDKKKKGESTHLSSVERVVPKHVDVDATRAMRRVNRDDC